VIAERGEAIRQVIRDAVDAGFNLDAPTCIVASPGRFRVFMGHTDLPGLGGPTINGATLRGADWRGAERRTPAALSS
jgi:hypothetical protein